MNRSAWLSRRFSLLLLSTFVVAIIFAARLAYIQVLDAGRLNEESAQHGTVTRTLYGMRGSILDANGVVLAESVERYDITVSPKYVADYTRDGITVTVDQALEDVASATGAKASDLKAAATRNPTSDFAYLVKGVTITVLRQVQALNVPWVYSELRPSRTYPRGAVGGNLTGFVGTDGPLTGIEYSKNKCLASVNGMQTYSQGSDGIRIPGSTESQKDPTDGGTIHLTIDSDLQWFAQQVIAARSKELQAQWATAIIVRVADGHILAAADWPSVDPNNVDGSKIEDMGSRLFSSPYEPGSTFKPMTVAKMLDAGQTTPTSHYIVPPRFQVTQHKYISDFFEHGTEQWTTTGILVYSSNIGMNILAKNLTKTERYNNLVAFGIGQQTGVRFLGEDPGFIQTPDKVDGVTADAELFGQGVSATGAQIASIYQTLGNHGVRVPLTLVSGCTHPDGTVTDLPDTTPTRVVSQSAADDTISMLENVATKGSLAGIATVPGYRVALKSGTAEVARYGKYTADRIISVAGIAPAENPQFAVVVTFGLPKIGRTSASAAVSFSKLMGQTLKYYRVAPSTGHAPNLPVNW